MTIDITASPCAFSTSECRNIPSSPHECCSSIRSRSVQVCTDWPSTKNTEFPSKPLTSVCTEAGKGPAFVRPAFRLRAPPLLPRPLPRPPREGFSFCRLTTPVCKITQGLMRQRSKVTGYPGLDQDDPVAGAHLADLFHLFLHLAGHPTHASAHLHKVHRCLKLLLRLYLALESCRPCGGCFGPWQPA